ncbi:MAG: hypothetical protein FJ280_00240 [Planctomycetes bacterium]|nr:hypothetical protein [Planctomycetota bacterium]
MTDEHGRLKNREDAAEAIRHLGEEDLRYLNRLIVERLKLIAQARSTALMARFHTGDRVGFRTSSGEWKHGVIQRLNQKTASILTDDGQRWNVAPAFLAPAGHLPERRSGRP